MSSPRQPDPWRGPLLLVLAFVLAVLAVVTTLPYPSHKRNLLGYRSVCAFVPLSTLTLAGAAGFAMALRSSSAAGKRRPRT
ncbi:MAG TPA: hypothetical protein VKU44_01910 [Terriglobia bacterium]|nr:hypothetical protein [Terriglobia bacterium]